MDEYFAHNDSFAQSLLSIEKQSEDLYIAILDDEIEVVFHLPPYRQALQYAVLLDKCPDTYFKTLIYERIFELVAEGDWRESATATLPAGVAQTIARLALYLSGVHGEVDQYTQSLIEAYRDDKHLSQLLQFMLRTICSVFPGYTFQDLYNLTYQQLVEIFIQAERLLIERGIIKDGYKLSLPSEKKTKKPAVDIEQLIRDDRKMIRDLNAPPAPTKIYDDPRYKLRKELQEARKHNLHRRLGKG